MPMGIAGSNVVQKFYDGAPGEKIKENKNLRTLWVSKSTIFSAIVHKDSSYKTLEDLKGKKVSIGNKGGSAYESIITFLEALGMSGDYYRLQFLTMNESLDAMRTGNIDAFFTNTSDPHTAMTEVFTMPGGARFLDFPQSVLNTLLSKVPYLKPAVRPAGTYYGQETDLVSVGSPYVLVVTEEFPDDVAYEIAKTFDEKYDEWLSIAANIEGSTLEATVKNAYAPLHDGVERYAKEKGLLK
jgi:TRAP transporter TAXI family solute receptor